MRRFIVAALAVLTSFAHAGFSQIDFFRYVYSYKTFFGTRHKVFEVPIWDESQAKYWLGYQFLQERPGKAYAVSFSDGREWLGIINEEDEVRGLWMNRSNGKYDSRTTFLHADSTTPGFKNLSNFFIDEDKNAYFQSEYGLKLVSAHLNDSAEFDTWSIDSSGRDYIGVTGICDNNIHKAIALGNNGFIYIFTPDLSVVDSVALPGCEGSTLIRLKSDSKLDSNGISTLWVQATKIVNNTTEYGFFKVNLNAASLSINSRFYPLRIPSGSQVPTGVNPISMWKDFIPFSVGANDLRIIAIANDYIHVFSEQGIWIESPWGTTQTPDGSTWYSASDHGSLYYAQTVISTNNRKNWQSHQDIIVADDFQASGHGLKRLSWTPDGYSDYLSLDVEMKETAKSTEPVSKPKILIKNLSSSRQLSQFKLRLWYSRQEGYPETVQSDAYYFEAESTKLSSDCSTSNPNLCWTDIVFDTGYAIDPEQQTGVDGIQLGIHFSDWRAWNKSNDYSWVGISDTFSTASNITVYEQGTSTDEWKKIWGNEPNPDSFPLPYGWVAGPPAVDNSESSIISMDDLTGWGCSGNGSCLLNRASYTEGSASISVSGGGWTLLTSKPFEYSGGLSKVKFDVWQPIVMINPYWTGQVQLSIECPSVGLYSQWVGQAELTSLTKGSWITLGFDVPYWISQKLTSNVTDLELKISVNAQIGAGTYSLDNVQLIK
jgi:hypothetical protein